MVTTHALPDLQKSTVETLTQARTVHAFAITTYTRASSKDKHDVEDSTIRNANKRDLLVIGCRKKVVVYGAGKGGMKDAWVSTRFLLLNKADALLGAVITTFSSTCYIPLYPLNLAST